MPNPAVSTTPTTPARFLLAGLLTMLTLAGACAPSADRDRLAPILPPALNRGDTIAFIAPAGKLDRVRMELARKRLEAEGFVVKVPEDLYRNRGYLAGTDERRAAELMAAFTDPTVKAVLPGTGGYGASRILDQLDYDVIRNNPKVFIGFSDITALHLAIQKKCGLVTFHTPNPQWGLGSTDNLKPISAKYFWRTLRNADYFDPAGKPLPPGFEYEWPSDIAPFKVVVPGVARGRLTGGNLSLIAALMGTPYEMETAGRVLFIEDIDERPYRIDRFLCQLRSAGKLKGLAAVILGQFTNCEPKPDEVSLSLEEVLLDYFGEMKVPVIMNFPAGHVPNNLTLPFGAMVEVDTHAGRVRVLENPVKLVAEAAR
ncbi:MAG: LD-carboxypeptidase [Phycisphaerae bacterium]|nr:LD-carboxypeptidase [Phycisphaerae bacterium]